MPKFIIIKEGDNCATSLEDIHEGAEIEINPSFSIKANDEIPLGHKFALKDIKRGQHVRKYNQIIGVATVDIMIGDWVHTHNIKSAYLEETVK
jgi:(2R)-sulfolactate sulfo-lyase subunit alpha